VEAWEKGKKKEGDQGRGGRGKKDRLGGGRINPYSEGEQKTPSEEGKRVRRFLRLSYHERGKRRLRGNEVN